MDRPSNIVVFGGKPLELFRGERRPAGAAPVVKQLTDEERERIRLDARDTNERIRKAVDEARVTKFLEEAARTRPIPRLGVDVVKPDVERRLDALAVDIRKADPSLTVELATAEAYQREPELYAQLQETIRKDSDWVLDDGDWVIGNSNSSDAAAAEKKLNAIAADILKTTPSLTREQALAAALERNPDLYAAMKE